MQSAGSDRIKVLGRFLGISPHRTISQADNAVKIKCHGESHIVHAAFHIRIPQRKCEKASIADNTMDAKQCHNQYVKRYWRFIRSLPIGIERLLVLGQRIVNGLRRIGQIFLHELVGIVIGLLDTRRLRNDEQVLGGVR